jgi:hypothetical protein
MRKYAQIYKQKVVFLTETTLTLDEVRSNFGDEAIWLDVTGLADVGIGYIQGLDADGKFTLIPPTVDDMNNVTEKERRAKIMLILMTNLKAKYNKIAMENGFVSIDDALIATIINDAMEADTSVASKLGEDYYKQRALVRNYFSTEHYQYYKGDYQFFRLGDIDRILEDAKPAVVEKEKPEVPGPVPGTPTPADPPGFDNHNNIVDDIPELPPLPEEGHHTVPTVPTNDDNTGDIPELPPLPPEGTNDATTGGDVPELPPLPPTDGHTEITPHENEPGSASPTEPPAHPSEDETVPELPKEPDDGTVIKPPVVGNDDIPPLPPTDDELPPLPGESTDTHTSEPTVKIPTTMPDGSPLPANATVDPRTGDIDVDDGDYITTYHPDGSTSVSAKDRL